MARLEAAPFRLLILATPDFNVAATMAFVDPFRAANHLDGTHHFRWDLASEQGASARPRTAPRSPPCPSPTCCAPRWTR